MELIDARQAARAATRRLMLGLGLALALSAGGARAQD